MDLDQLIQLPQDEIISSLSKYQRDLVKDLIKTNDNDLQKSADMWLTSSMAQTAEFGGDHNRSHIYREKIMEEIEKFICGEDISYKADREKIAKETGATKEYIIGVLSSAIGNHLGVAGTFIAPVIVLLLMSFGKICVKAWCDMRKQERESKTL